MQEILVGFLGWEDPLEKGIGYPLQYSGLENSMDYPWGCKESDMTQQRSLSLSRGFPCSSMVKNPPANAGVMDLILGSGRSPGEENGN